MTNDHGPGRIESVLARAVDLGLEATVVGGHTSIGFDLRRRLEHWPDVDAGALAGRRYVITGASSGIGFEAARILLSAGASVRSASRSRDKADRATAELRAAVPNADVELSVADLSRPDDTSRFADRIGSEFDRIDGLAHCAGAFFDELTLTPEGFDANTAIYVLGPHLLTRELEATLQVASEPRVVFVSSSGAYARRFDLDALSPSADSYRPLAAYAHAKRAQIVLTHAWARRLDGVAVDAMTPGWCDTPLVRQGLPRFGTVFGPILRTPTQGADTVAWLMARPDPRAVTNRLWRDRHPRLEHRGPWTLGGDGPEDLWRWCNDHLPAQAPTARRYPPPQPPASGRFGEGAAR